MDTQKLVSRDDKLEVLLSGTLDAKSATSFVEFFNNEGAKKNVLLNCENLRSISIAGICSLLAITRQLKNNKLTIKISGANYFVRDILNLSGLLIHCM